jgi:predicted permease
MSFWRRLTNRITGRSDRDLDREICAHLDLEEEEQRDAGLPPEDASRAARRSFGNVTLAKEDTRAMWGWTKCEQVLQDIRYAFRGARKSPGFAVVAILSLALGIGGSAAIFSLVDQVLLRTLPVRAPDRLVQLRWIGSSVGSNYGADYMLSYPLVRDLQTQAQVFDGVFGRHPSTAHVSTGQQAEPLRIEIVSGSYFPVLGVRPALGRLIDPSDDLQVGAHPVAVLSYRYWQNRLGGAPDVVGRRILVNKYPLTVIGVASAEFSGVDPLAVPVLWIPAVMAPQAGGIDAYWNEVLNRRVFWLNVFARLKPGMTSEQAQAAIQPWFKANLDAEQRSEGFPLLTSEQRSRFLGSTMEVVKAPGGLSLLRRALTRPLWVLMGGTVLLLLLASLNVAGLLLARGAARSRELTTRLALGATRGRITSQVLVEALLITLGGGALGLAVAPALSRTLLALFAQDSTLNPGIDQRVLLFAFIAAVTTGLACGLAPAFQTGRVSLITSLAGRSRLANANGIRLRKLLVIGQIAFTLILLIGAGLFVQTLARLHERVGFASSNLLTMSVSPPAGGYAAADAERVMREVFRRLEELPVVEHVGILNAGLLNGGRAGGPITIQAERRFPSDRAVLRLRVTPGFFATLGTPIVAGRDFDAREVRPAGTESRPPRAVIVNEGFARRYFKDRSPIGARIAMGNRPDAIADIEIIGVVKDFSRSTLRDGDIELIILPFWDGAAEDGNFFVRTRGSADAAASSIRAVVAQIDPGIPVTVRTFDDQIEQSLRNERMLAALSSAFGAIALLLSVVGLYGVMTFVVTQRTQEIGLRLALGATRGAAVWLVLRDALLMIVLGGVIGLSAAWALQRMVEAQLFDIQPFHPPTIAAASAMLALVALGAAMLPAWRAASVSPTEALRAE